MKQNSRSVSAKSFSGDHCAFPRTVASLLPEAPGDQVEMPKPFLELDYAGKMVSKNLYLFIYNLFI